jgi:hypothetical protein
MDTLLRSHNHLATPHNPSILAPTYIYISPSWEDVE